jgi:hypothetical protein
VSLEAVKNLTESPEAVKNLTESLEAVKNLTESLEAVKNLTGIPYFGVLLHFLSHLLIPFTPTTPLHTKNRGFFLPYACQPVSNECESCHEQNEDGGAVLRVSVDLPRDSDQTEKASSLEQTYQGCRLQKKANRSRSKIKILDLRFPRDRQRM